MMSWDDVEQWGMRLAGVAGALVSMRFVNGTVTQKLTMAFGGATFSFYASDWAANALALPVGLTGFLLGLFGMSVLARMWEWMQTTNVVRDFLDAWFRRGEARRDRNER